MATRVFGPGVEPGGMDLDDNHDEVQCPACKGKAEREAEDREFVLASLDWLTMSDFRAFTAGIRQAA
ncbi:hypothetical protein [Pseudomonas lactis]|uniref:hypothetical protein n=1 Tax=Pseudomonas lactis TaxID=1615674 RepID=UPI0003DC6EBB|nr:hypothetical protein [Pseudomonas lactis]ETK43418.1 hypothetical protein H098_01815 [Pseudomonas fluorescens FH5]MBK3445739.1 hypothetical protein [Pseudomonas lactis]